MSSSSQISGPGFCTCANADKAGAKVLNNVLFKKDERFPRLFGFWVFTPGRLFSVSVGIVITTDFRVVFVSLEVDGSCLIGMSERCCGCDFVARD